MLWKNKSKHFDKLRAEIDKIPVIETHQHYLGTCKQDKKLDILAFLIQGGYHPSDIQSASDDFNNKKNSKIPSHQSANGYIADSKINFNKRFEVLEKYWGRTCYTGYAKGLAEGLKACWGLKNFSKKSLLDLQEKMRAKRDQKFYDKLYRQYHLKAMIVNTGLEEIIENNTQFNKSICRFVFNLPGYHALFTQGDIHKPHVENIFGGKIISLDDYLDAVEMYLKKAIDFGIVGIKDQTAYRRKISYENTGRGVAEALFNKIVANPRDTFSTQEMKPLDDFLFHEFMKLAAKYELPVQIHTGHMAGIRNDIEKTNPVHLTSVLELHSNVTFDLFHGGWPYMGEYLFLGKNYPNVNLDMCWCNAIDPLYSVELFKRAIMTVPHTKISGFGGDCNIIEAHIGYLIQARDNIAIALSDLIDTGWLDMDAAVKIAKDWLHNNPKRIFSI